MAEWQRTHTCGELRDLHIGQMVVLNGWVNTFRGYNDQVFVDIRDRYGITQVVLEADDPAIVAVGKEIGREFVISVAGKVAARLPGKDNAKMATGKIEVKAAKVAILNRCPTPPFEITEFGTEIANEDLRLQYRYLDLRRKSLQNVLIIRHRLNKVIRDHLDFQGFLEMETPLLGKSTPEGARDYLVPSRVWHGEWYALPQSPQLYKQLLMVAGYDKYFQIARCLRDEDLRADRQPEFTQLDVEMSFVEMDDIFRVVEGLVADIFHRVLGINITTPLPRLKYAEAMLKYGSDKPDLRFGMEITEVSDLAGQSEFKVFKDVLAAGGVVRGLNARKAADKFSNTDLKPGGKLSEFVAGYKAKGLAWMKVEADKFTGSIEKFFGPEQQKSLRERFKAEAGDVLLFVADQEPVVCDALGALRSHLAAQLKLYTNWWERGEDAKPTADDFKIAWVIDFPSFMYDAEEKRWVANHHPFTAPRDEHIAHLESDPGKVLAKAYDLVINGYEVGGGSIRIHNPEVQSRVFTALGMPIEDAKQRFGFLLDALKFGAPPHGGIALGLDRFAMMLAGTTNIRDVIAFPKNQRARDLMTGAPAPVESRQLKDLGLMT
ncbi:MAG: aspartate--tRNA ligase [Planctomycetes bacterium]|nr:aspartate--tRNA ligase [Planctomycetota bacterium]